MWTKMSILDQHPYNFQKFSIFTPVHLTDIMMNTFADHTVL